MKRFHRQLLASFPDGFHTFCLKALSEITGGNMKKRILHLTLHRIWFDKIANGIKKEEYRGNKPYYPVRKDFRD